METLRGRLVQGGLLVSENVAVQLDVGADWWGTLRLPGEDIVRPGDRYTLTLDDGRSGLIFLQTATYWDGSETQALFQGRGPLH